MSNEQKIGNKPSVCWLPEYDIIFEKLKNKPN